MTRWSALRARLVAMLPRRRRLVPLEPYNGALRDIFEAADFTGTQPIEGLPNGRVRVICTEEELARRRVAAYRAAYPLLNDSFIGATPMLEALSHIRHATEGGTIAVPVTPFTLHDVTQPFDRLPFSFQRRPSTKAQRDIWKGELLRACSVRIRQLCERVGGQNEFARRLGLQHSVVGRWHAGTSLPTIDHAVLICETFHCTLDWLLERSDTGGPHK